MRVGPESVISLLQTLTDAGIPHHTIALDLHRFNRAFVVMQCMPLDI